MRRIIERDVAIRVIRVARISVKRCYVRMQRFKNRRSLILYSLRAPPFFPRLCLIAGNVVTCSTLKRLLKNMLIHRMAL